MSSHRPSWLQSIWHRLSPGPALIVPEKFNRNSRNVSSLMPPHQNPNDAASIFTILRRYTAVGGHLFFTCFLDAGIAEYEDRSPEKTGGRCFYNPDFLARLVEGCGWRVVKRAPGEGPVIGDSFVCALA